MRNCQWLTGLGQEVHRRSYGRTKWHVVDIAMTYFDVDLFSYFSIFENRVLDHETNESKYVDRAIIAAYI